MSRKNCALHIYFNWQGKYYTEPLWFWIQLPSVAEFYSYKWPATNSCRWPRDKSTHLITFEGATDDSES